VLNYFSQIRLYICKQLTSVFSLCSFALALSFSGLVIAEEINSVDELLTQNTSLSSQAALKFKHLLSADGLSQNNVFDITQDHDGFIWIATEDGLNRYDGKNFVFYRKDLADKNSIANNWIRKVFVDNDGVLWVGTQKGLSKYNVELDNFENYYHQEGKSDSLKDDLIWDIYQDKKMNIWVSTTSGIQKYNSDSNNFKHVKIHGLEEEIKQIYTIFQDSNNNYWFGGYDNGIYLASKNLDNSSSLQKKNNFWKISIPADSLFDIKEINNHYWLATEQGIYVLDQNYTIIDRYHIDHPTNKLISNIIRSITQVDESTVWVGTKHGLNLINLKTSSITKHTSNTTDKSLSSNWINSVFKDKFENLWLGTYGEGLNLFLKDSLGFAHFLSGTPSSTIGSLAETTDGKIWFYALESGLNYISNTGEITPKNILKNKEINQLITDNNNNLWVNTFSNQLFIYSQHKNTLTEIALWQKESLYDQNYTFNLLNNSIWFIDINGQLANYQLATQTFNRFTIKDGNQNKIKAIHIDENNILWTFSSNNQLISLKITSSNIVENSITYHDLLNVNNLSMIDVWNIKAYGSSVWLTSGQGVLLYNKEKKTTDYFNESNGLINNAIDSIEIDEKENAWLSTNGAISFISPNTKNISNFSQDLHLSDNGFIYNSSLKATNGKIYFGGTNGFHQLSPLKIANIEQQINSPIFTDLFIKNESINVKTFIQTGESEKTFTINRNINNLKTLTLSHEQFPFDIAFSSPNSSLPNQISYRFRLKEIQEEWIPAGINKQFATYTNLDPGDYIFEVEAYNSLGTIKGKKNTLNIHIMAPWWLSQTALIIYALLCFSAIAYVIQQMRHKRLYHLQIQKSEERLKLSLWGSGDEMWDWNIITGKIYRSNIWGILEFPQDGKRNVGADKTNIHEHDISRVRDSINEHFDDRTDHFEATYRVKNKDDKWIWVLDRGKIVERDDKGTPTRMTGTLKDISRIKKADERLKLFAKCIENISDAVIIYDRKFNIVDVNKSFQRITKKSKKQMLGKILRFTQYPEVFTQDVKKHLITKGSWHGEIESVRENGEIYLTDLNIDIIHDENKSISHFVGVFSDITKRKETEAELRKLANSDTLTGLPNRSYFQANQTLLVNKKVPHALLVFDLDNFKKINDSMGHEVGDVLLCQVAKRMRAVGRKQDTVYRLGGDEFSIIIENTNDIHTITSIATEVLTTIAQPLRLKSQEVVLFSSLGIVLYPEDGATPQELLKNADTAMYHAKNNGGNKYQFFNDSMNKTAVKRLQIESLIRYGLKEDSFSVFYQPKIEIATGKVAGMEALVRFETPSNGIISPITFIPVSEETGQIIDIGEVVLRKSCYATKKWVDAGLFNGRVAVNLSAVQFTQPNLVGMIADILKESQLPAKYLELEITEGTVMDSPQAAIDIMLQIRAMGIHLSLDDFGTGYSSLAYLKKFPLNTLKIDKAFVDDIEESEQGRNMVATIVTIAHNLGMQVVAEGVETNQQLSFLSGLRCEQLQGYLYSKPLPKSDFQKYLLSHQITTASTNFGKASR